MEDDTFQYKSRQEATRSSNPWRLTVSGLKFDAVDPLTIHLDPTSDRIIQYH